MKSTRRFLSVIAAISVLISTFSSSAFAEENSDLIWTLFSPKAAWDRLKSLEAQTSKTAQHRSSLESESNCIWCLVSFKSRLPHQQELRKTPNLRRLRSSFFIWNCLWDLFGTYFSDSLRPTKKLTLMTHLFGTCHRCCFCLLWSFLSCRSLTAEPRLLRP